MAVHNKSHYYTAEYYIHGEYTRSKFSPIQRVRFMSQIYSADPDSLFKVAQKPWLQFLRCENIALPAAGRGLYQSYKTRTRSLPFGSHFSKFRPVQSM